MGPVRSEDLRRNSIPAPGTCPTCGGAFVVVGRSGTWLNARDPVDELFWRCAACGHEESEKRRLADGTGDDWPVSRFSPLDE
ncbi:MAG TPA: hypothetical protein VHB46_19375 [Burkholderiales bacterium]|nr:hypothetical protein [Burkholderiales bacterium]